MRWKRAYIDIETTGLCADRAHLTVIGVGIECGDLFDLHQLIGHALSAESLQKLLEGVGRVYTYNGRRFDFPFIRHHLDLNVEEVCSHTDLMLECWKHHLKGGLKRVERTLGITRELPDVNGLDAVRWWRRYRDHGDEEALRRLLLYNAEDVRNLTALRRCLRVG